MTEWAGLWESPQGHLVHLLAQSRAAFEVRTESSWLKVLSAKRGNGLSTSACCALTQGKRFSLAWRLMKCKEHEVRFTPRWCGDYRSCKAPCREGARYMSHDSRESTPLQRALCPSHQCHRGIQLPQLIQNIRRIKAHLGHFKDNFCCVVGGKQTNKN